MYGLSDQLVRQITDAAVRFGVQKLVLFGSRARGDYRAASDIDLAVYGLKSELPLRDALEELPTLLKFDVVPVHEGIDRLLLAEIERDGVVLMEKRITKLDQFAMAFARTREAIAEYEQTRSQVVRDGVIQRFEFTCELAWKSCREHLIEEGFSGIDSPKAAMRQAFACALIDDEQGWLNLLQARNLTSHMYSETQAQEIYEQIETAFMPLFEKLLLKLSI
ncbi:MAG: nucleotidyltransferase substrate binding protein [Clostridia bacterium]|nr:nucleotidyltransferase substrate binding protein [Clostridia bacterium]